MLVRRSVLLILVTAGLAAAAGWAFADLPSVDRLAETRSSVLILDRAGRLLYEIETDQGSNRPVTLADVAPIAVAATIATEDAHFFHHPGVDPVALVRATIQSIRGEPSGGSTLEMQLARHVLLADDPARSPPVRRKMREIVLALQIARRFSKEEILTLYLNRVPYGARAIGIEAASQAYFGTSAINLSAGEAALLVGLPQAPARYDPRDDPSEAMQRRRAVLALMARRGLITVQEAERIASEAVQLRSPVPPIAAPHFVVGTRERALQFASETGGTRIVTTLDAGLQQLAERVIERHLARLADHDVTNAALVAIDPTSGDILALAGSADYFNPQIHGQVNVAASPRQPGSAIKPLTFAAAFERGFAPADVFYDVRSAFTTRRGETFVPVNYDHQYHGPLSLRTALGSSINVVAVQLLDRIGVGALIEMGQRLGITTWGDADRYDLALTLGGGEVTLLELTAAYSAFANGGLFHQPSDLLRIESREGRTILEVGREPPRRVLTPETAFFIAHILSDPRARELSFGMDNPLTMARPAGVKTGTTSGFRDNWTVGFTPQLVVGVWVGNSDGRPMRDVSGITGAAPIWREFLSEALRDEPALPFPVPDGIRWVSVCEVDGKLATPECPRVVLEPFVAGSEPTEHSTSYQRIVIDSATGGRWELGCRGPAIERLYWIIPPEALGWARDQGIPQAPVHGCASGVLPDSERFVRLVVPDDRAEFVISPRLPTIMQRLYIRAVAGGGTVQLSVDGSPIGPPGAAEGWWTLQPGQHVIRATLIRDGREFAADERVVRVAGVSGGQEP
ncbi:MAG: penicillin-binding protein 1A [Dehalococcoidia bacterium]|nr:MAG: penicillin-binding protein 1A [Dehalococcoidia bacterium]